LTYWDGCYGNVVVLVRPGGLFHQMLLLYNDGLIFKVCLLFRWYVCYIWLLYNGQWS